MIPVWPEINFLAQKGSWQLQLSDGRSRTSSDMDSGDTRARTRFTRVVSPVAFSLFMPSEETEIFKYFYATIVKDGTLWFYMPIYDGSEYRISLVRFSLGSNPSISELGYRSNIVNVALDVRNLTLITKDIYEYFSRVGVTRGVKLSDSIYHFVNVTYPGTKGL